MPIIKKPNRNFLYQRFENKVGILHSNPPKCRARKRKLERVTDEMRGWWGEGTEYIDTEKPQVEVKTYLCRRCNV